MTLSQETRTYEMIKPIPISRRRQLLLIMMNVFTFHLFHCTNIRSECVGMSYEKETLERLHKISISYSDCCPRCKTEVGTLLHMFWSCSELETYWRNIIQTIDKIVNIRLPSDPRFMLLGDESILQFDQRKNFRLVKMALIAANKCIAIQWKSEEPPIHILWLREISSYVPIEKIMFNLKKK